MPSGAPITLKEVQLRLGVPQHILIHLCEKGVIEPDFADTSGRGKHREFSDRNLFEFGVALALRKLEVPVATTAFVIRLLRSFERATKKALPSFEIPAVLIDGGLELGLHFYDGQFIVFSARGGELRKPLLLRAIADPAHDPTARPRVEPLDELPRAYDARLQLDLTRIARRVLG